MKTRGRFNMFDVLALGLALLGLLAPPALAQQTSSPTKKKSLPPGVVAHMEGGKFWHGAAIEGLAFSPDEKILASYGGNRLRLWDAKTGELLHHVEWKSEAEEPQFLSPYAPMSAQKLLSFSRDGKRLAVSVSGSQSYRIFDVHTGKQLQQVSLATTKGGFRLSPFLRARLGSVDPFALSPDGHALVVCSNYTAFLRDLKRNDKPVHLDGHAGTITSVDFSADGKFLVTGSTDQTLRLWDVKDGKQIRILRGHRAAVESVAFVADGSRIVSASSDGTLRLWETKSGKMLLRCPWIHSKLPPNDYDGSSYSSLMRSREGNTAIERIWFDGRENRIYCCYNASVSSYLVDSPWVVVSFDGKTGAEIKRHVLPFTRPARMRRISSISNSLDRAAVAFAIRRQIVAGATPTFHVRLVSLSTGKDMFHGPAFGGACEDVAMMGHLLAFSQQGEPTVYIWDWKKGKLLHRLQGHTGQPLLAGFSPTTKSLVTFSQDDSDRMVSAWDVNSGEEALQISGWEMGYVRSSRFSSIASPHLARPVVSPDGGLLVLRGVLGRMRVVNLKNGKDLPGFEHRWKGEATAGFTSDGRQLLVSDAATDLQRGAAGIQRETKTTIMVFDVKTGKKTRDLKAKPYSFVVSNLAVAGHQVLLASSDGALRRVSLETGKEIGMLRAAAAKKEDPNQGGFGRLRQTIPNNPISFLLSPNKHIVAILEPDKNEVQLLELASGKQRTALKGYPAPITSMRFSLDSRFLVTGHKDGSVLVWSLTTPPAGSAQLPASPSEKELAQLWSGLGSADPAKAFLTMQRLNTNPRQAVALIKKRLQPAAPLKPKTIKKLIADLDSPTFRVRETAFNKLMNLHESARRYLEEAEKTSTSEEFKERVHRLLGKLNQGELSVNRVRQLRAVEVLEWLDNKQALSVLQELARGRDPLLARHARAAVANLQRQKMAAR